MNRKQRRATHKHGRPAGSLPADSAGDQIQQLLVDAAECERLRKFDDAVRAYKRVLQLKPDHAEACNNLGRVLLAQGKPKDASAYFARSLVLMPQLLKQYAGICATLVALLPPFGEALRKQIGGLAKAADRKRAVWRRRTRCDRGQSVAAAGDAIDPGAGYRVRASPHRATPVAIERRAHPGSDFRHCDRFCLRPRAAVLHQ